MSRRPAHRAVALVVALGAGGVLFPPAVQGELVSCQSKKILASDGQASAAFGASAAIDGDLLVLGAIRGDDPAQYLGAAYLYRRGEGGEGAWGEIARLVPSDQSDHRHFGGSVALSGDTVVVGSTYPLSAPESRVYIYQRNVGGSDIWGEVKAIDPVADGSESRFGWSVAIDGDTAVVGAWGVNGDAGAAYVFERHAGGSDNWGRVAQLSPAELSSGDLFGWAVAIDGDTIVVSSMGGNHLQGMQAAYVFGRDEGGPDQWGKVAKLANPGSKWFGNAVDIDEDRVIVGGAPSFWSASEDGGSAHLFERNQGGHDAWGHRAHLRSSDLAVGDRFGHRVAIDGDTVIVGADRDDDTSDASGSVYLFRRNHGGPDAWGQAAKIVAFDPESGDSFGRSLAADRGTVAVGAFGDDDLGGDSGSAYVYEWSGDEWQETAKATSPEPDELGYGLALEVGLLAAGAPRDDGLGPDAGAVYLFERNQGGADAWDQLSKVTASDGELHDAFGESVALEQGTLLVGASGGASAYVFERTGDSAWTEAARLDPSGGSPDFGRDVDLEGDLAGVVGYASAHLYRRNAGGMGLWGEVAQLSSVSGDLGFAITVDHELVAVSRGNASGNSPPVMAVHLFARNAGGPEAWGEAAMLPNEALPGAHFGYALDLDDDTLVVGAPDWSSEGVPGTAYVYHRNLGGAGAWGLAATLSATSPEAGDAFGQSVSIDGDRIVVGAPGSLQGALYVFERDRGGDGAWGLADRVVASDPTTSAFGWSVGISGARVAGGAIFDSGSSLVSAAPRSGSFAEDESGRHRQSARSRGPGAHVAKVVPTGGGAAYVFDLDADFCPAPPDDFSTWWTGDGTGIELNGGPTATLLGGTTFTAGISGQGFDFDGVDDYVSIPDHSTLDVGTGDLSLTFWVRSTQDSGIGTIFDKRDSSPLRGYHAFLYLGSPGVQLADGSGHTNFVAPSLVADGSFHFVAVTLDRDSTDGGRIYVDGAEDLVFDPTGHQGSLSTDVEARLGRHSDATGGGFFLDGSLDEVQLYPRALSAPEVRALFAAQRSCPDTLVLRNQDVSSDSFFAACDEIATGTDFRVLAGELTLRAGRTVAFGDGFSVAQGAALRVEIEPILARD